MSHLKSLGFNQKNFNGTRPVTNAAINLGATRGKGSSTRMFNFCTQNSEAPSLCINSFITIAAAPPPVDILFNTSTFNNFNIPSVYKSALITAASRWSRFLKYNTETISLIRNSSTTERTYKNWNGIELTGFETNTTGDYRAEAETTYIGATSLNPTFTLKINTTQLSTSLPINFIIDVLTHELGHALGFNYQQVRVNGEPNGDELLPKLVSLTFFKKNATIDGQHPTGISIRYFPKAIGAYNDYGGTSEYQSGSYCSKRIYNGTNMPIEQNINYGFHISEKTFYSEELVPGTSFSKYIKFGFNNEIMTINTWLNTSRRHWISSVSIGFLLDLYSNLNGKNYYNYTQKDTGSEAALVLCMRPGTTLTIYDKPLR